MSPRKTAQLQKTNTNTKSTAHPTKGGRRKRPAAGRPGGARGSRRAGNPHSDDDDDEDDDDDDDDDQEEGADEHEEDIPPVSVTARRSGKKNEEGDDDVEDDDDEDDDEDVDAEENEGEEDDDEDVDDDEDEEELDDEDEDEEELDEEDDGGSEAGLNEVDEEEEQEEDGSEDVDDKDDDEDDDDEDDDDDDEDDDETGRARGKKGGSRRRKSPAVASSSRGGKTRKPCGACGGWEFSSRSASFRSKVRRAEKQEKDELRDWQRDVENAHTNVFQKLKHAWCTEILPFEEAIARADCIEIDPVSRLSVDGRHTTMNILYPFELAAVLAKRTAQLEKGAPTFLPGHPYLYPIDYHLVAQRELRLQLIPFFVKRRLNEGVNEYFRLSDMLVLEELEVDVVDFDSLIDATKAYS